MIKRIILCISILLCLPANGMARLVIDQLGRKVEVPDNPERLLPLAPSITEIVFSLGQGKRVKGVTRFSDFPPEVAALPKIGSYVHLDLEKIVALKPDLCLAIKDGNPKHTVEAIEALGIPVFVIDPHNLREIMAAIEKIGALLGSSEQSAKMVRDMHQRVEQVKRKVSQTTMRPKVFFQIDASPIVTVGRQTFTHELISLAGGINVAAGRVPYPRYSWEQVLALQPEIVFVTSMAGGYTTAKLKAEWQRWRQLPAVRNNRLYIVEAGVFDRPTARLVNGLEILAKRIHPQLFGEPE